MVEGPGGEPNAAHAFPLPGPPERTTLIRAPIDGPRGHPSATPPFKVFR
jgi:hypothetical protein